MPWLIEESAQVQGDYTHHTGLNHRQRVNEEFDNDEAVRLGPGWSIYRHARRWSPGNCFTQVVLKINEHKIFHSK